MVVVGPFWLLVISVEHVHVVTIHLVDSLWCWYTLWTSSVTWYGVVSEVDRQSVVLIHTVDVIRHVVRRRQWSGQTVCGVDTHRGRHPSRWYRPWTSSGTWYGVVSEVDRQSVVLIQTVDVIRHVDTDRGRHLSRGTASSVKWTDSLWCWYRPWTSSVTWYGVVSEVDRQYVVLIHTVDVIRHVVRRRQWSGQTVCGVDTDRGRHLARGTAWSVKSTTCMVAGDEDRGQHAECLLDQVHSESVEDDWWCSQPTTATTC